LTPWMVGQLSLKEAQVGGGPEEWAHLSAATVLMVAPLVLFAGVAMRLLSRRSIAK
jgi:ABC-type glycerol-3-phosphate transport system permease component